MNGTMLQDFEWYLPDDGSHWRHVAESAESLREMGFTAVWLPPACKAAGGIHDVGYGVYDLYDLGEFNQKGAVRTKYGTKEEYLAAIRALQSAGIQVYADVVLNQRMGADETEQVDVVEVNPQNREQVVSGEEKIAAYTKFTFPGRKGKYSDFIWDHTCFDGVDWDAASQRSRIFEMEGVSWDPDVDGEDGNYDYLMGADVNFQSEKVVQELNRWGRWYYDTAHMDGFRLDAVKHICSEFYRQWVPMMRDYAKKDLFVVGEYWNGDVGRLLNYLDRVDSCMSLFDAPLHYRLYEASSSNGTFDMRNLLQGTLVKERSMNTVTIVGNHDTQPTQALESWVESWFRPQAYAVILLRQEGYPCVFYGDIYGIPHNNINPIGEPLLKMLKIRQTYAYGAQHDYFDHPDVIGWTREGDSAENGLAVLLTNARGGQKTMYVGRQHAGQTYRSVFGGSPVVIGEDGNAVFSVPDGGLSVYLPEV
ncbi:MAG: alpha-amylase [Acutalibacteraceae bacterium]